MLKLARPVVAMKTALGSILWLCMFTSAAANQKAGVEVTPVQKVLQLMNGMLVKGKKMKADEEVQYAAFQQFCTDTAAEKKRLIEDAEAKIDKLIVDIEKYNADAARLAKEITEHEEDISKLQSEQEAATKVRKEEKATYTELYNDQSESIDALERAIEVLKKPPKSTAQASLVQVSALTNLQLIPEHAKKVISSFLQKYPASEETDLLETDAPEAAGYEFQSQGIIDMLDKLLDKFVAERTQMEKEEMNKANAYGLMMQDMQGQEEQETQDKTEKIATKAARLQAAAEAGADKTATFDTKQSDKKYLLDLTVTCERKADDFKQRQDLRQEELDAIAKAIEIVGSGDVSGAADKHLPSLLQVKAKGSALAQLRAKTLDDNVLRVSSFLREEGNKIGSRLLLQVAEHAEDDPFRKVKKMIKDLITKLMEEAVDEAEHKAWCDTELTTNAQTRKEKTSAVETLTSEIDELEATIAKLGEDIAELTKAIEDLAAAMTKATELRQAEKEKNTNTISDAKQAEIAVAKALVVLKEFYAKAGDATALVQQPLPEIFDSPYKGMQSENGGVVGMLEVIESDFSRLRAETKAAEAAAQKEYDEFMTDSMTDKATKETEMKHKEEKKQDKEQTLLSKKEDLENTQNELDKALAYFDKLKPSCVETGENYEDRVARRKAEIQSLKEALEILSQKAE